jgi:hypothetical protein
MGQTEKDSVEGRFRQCLPSAMSQCKSTVESVGKESRKMARFVRTTLLIHLVSTIVLVSATAFDFAVFFPKLWRNRLYRYIVPFALHVVSIRAERP